MAMGGFEREDLTAPLAEINTTPLVDVMLVLLVIFLVTAPMLTQAIKLELPNEIASEIKEQKPVTVSIDNKGQYYIDDKALSTDELDLHLKEIAAANPKQQILLRADTETTYGKVSHILSAATKAGLSNVGFVTEPK
jgi:biopolymer transport protein ExbD